jgi:hypothetical protein
LSRWDAGFSFETFWSNEIMSAGNRHRTDSQRRQRSQDLKIDNLRRNIAAGVAALERGEYTEVEDTDLDTYLDGLVTGAR